MGEPPRPFIAPPGGGDFEESVWWLGPGPGGRGCWGLVPARGLLLAGSSYLHPTLPPLEGGGFSSEF